MSALIVFSYDCVKGSFVRSLVENYWVTMKLLLELSFIPKPTLAQLDLTIFLK